MLAKFFVRGDVSDSGFLQLGSQKRAVLGMAQAHTEPKGTRGMLRVPFRMAHALSTKRSLISLKTHIHEDDRGCVCTRRSPAVCKPCCKRLELQRTCVQRTLQKPGQKTREDHSLQPTSASGGPSLPGQDNAGRSQASHALSNVGIAGNK